MPLAIGRLQVDPPVVRAVVISDLNASYGSTHYPDEVSLAVKHITGTWDPDFVLVAGDMVAGQSTQLTDSTVRAMWEAFDSVVAMIADRSSASPTARLPPRSSTISPSASRAVARSAAGV